MSDVDGYRGFHGKIQQTKTKYVEFDGVRACRRGTVLAISYLVESVLEVSRL